MNLGKTLRFALLAVVSSAVYQACGGLDPGTVTVIDDSTDAGSGNDTQAAGGGGGSPTSNQGGDGNVGHDGGAAGQSPGVGGEGAGDCVTGKPCLNGPDTGICAAGTCTTCKDPDDDSACQEAYGDGYICVAGSCLEAECRGDDDCAGLSCSNNKCSPCSHDSDCKQANTICNVGTGACVTKASCGTAKNGAPCPVNDQDLCCGAGASCEAVQCCGTAACKTDPKQVSNDGACQAGICVRSGCAAPPTASRFVDFEAAPGGNGSKSCPFAKLAPAVDALANTGGTVLVMGGAVASTTEAIAVGPGITITGADDAFAPCTPTTCASAAKWTQITTGDRRAFDLRTAGNRAIRYLRLVGLPDAEFQRATWAAIYASAATVDVDHLVISGYQYGLYADTAGSLAVGAGFRAHHCKSGLYLENGETSAGGGAVISATVGDQPISFDHNNFGLVAHGNALFQLSGPPAGRGKTSLISANDNGGSGVYFPASNPKGLIDGLEATGNGGDATLGQHDGATVFAHSAVKIRNSYFHDNVGSGIHIPGNGPNDASGLSAIDLGKDATTNAGKNTFINNGDAGICVEMGPAKAADKNSLHAQGNTFRTSGGDCTVEGSTYVRAAACDGSKADFAGACAGAADLELCEPSTPCP